jgi:hypothetical protein
MDGELMKIREGSCANKLLFLILIVVGLVILAVVSTKKYAGDLANRPAPSTSESRRSVAKTEPAPPPGPTREEQLEKLKRESTPVTAAQVVGAYTTNEIAADQNMKDRWMKVTGEIDSIGKDILGSPYVALKTGNTTSFRGLQCVFDEKHMNQLAELRPSQKVIIFGKCSGMFGNVIIRECQLCDE